MLTPEERVRIEEEERKRIAEEQYRKEVRARLKDVGPTEVTRRNPVPWIIGIGLAILIGTFLVGNRTSQSKGGDGKDSVHAATDPAPAPPVPVSKTRLVPVDQKVATGQIIVRAGGAVQYRITVLPEMIQPTVTGTFNASGGSGNDIQAVIVDEMNLTNFINGHQAQVFWQTTGRETTGNLDVKLGPGTYYLVFSNKFSTFTEKQVFLEVNLGYQKSETYYE